MEDLDRQEDAPMTEVIDATVHSQMLVNKVDQRRTTGERHRRKAHWLQWVVCSNSKENKCTIAGCIIPANYKTYRRLHGSQLLPRCLNLFFKLTAVSLVRLHGSQLLPRRLNLFFKLTAMSLLRLHGSQILPRCLNLFFMLTAMSLLCRGIPRIHSALPYYFVVVRVHPTGQTTARMKISSN